MEFCQVLATSFRCKVLTPISYQIFMQLALGRPIADMATDWPWYFTPAFSTSVTTETQLIPTRCQIHLILIFIGDSPGHFLNLVDYQANLVIIGTHQTLKKKTKLGPGWERCVM